MEEVSFKNNHIGLKSDHLGIKNNHLLYIVKVITSHISLKIDQIIGLPIYHILNIEQPHMRYSLKVNRPFLLNKREYIIILNIIIIKLYPLHYFLVFLVYFLRTFQNKF